MVLSKEEVRAVVQQLLGIYRLVVRLLYGFKQIEYLRHRVKDVDFAQHKIVVWHNSHTKLRRTWCAKSIRFLIDHDNFLLDVELS